MRDLRRALRYNNARTRLPFVCSFRPPGNFRQVYFDGQLRALRALMGGAAFAQLWAMGITMSMEQALALKLIQTE